jgi:mRNA-binding protein PUF3
MKPQLISLKKYNYGKQIAAIEKLIFTGPPSYATAPAIPIEIATPLLTDGQNSPQSSSLPSTSVSTIDEPAEPPKKETEELGGEKGCPEVIINGD